MLLRLELPSLESWGDVVDSEILEAAIRSVEGVQKEREVVAWLMELNEFEMVYWAAWWVATYLDRYAVQDRANKAMIKSLREAGVVLPYRKGRVDLEYRLESNRFSGDQDEK
jgi:small-conductance mechanosensitive channel